MSIPKHWNRNTLVTNLCAGLVLVLVELHGPSGQIVEINPAEVSSVRQPLDVRGHWMQGTKCIIVMSNGGYIATSEDCPTVTQKLK